MATHYDFGLTSLGPKGQTHVRFIVHFHWIKLLFILDINDIYIIVLHYLFEVGPHYLGLLMNMIGPCFLFFARSAPKPSLGL